MMGSRMTGGPLGKAVTKNDNTNIIKLQPRPLQYHSSHPLITLPHSSYGSLFKCNFTGVHWVRHTIFQYKTQSSHFVTGQKTCKVTHEYTYAGTKSIYTCAGISKHVQGYSNIYRDIQTFTCTFVTSLLKTFLNGRNEVLWDIHTYSLVHKLHFHQLLPGQGLNTELQLP